MMNSNESLPLQIKAGRHGFTLVPEPEAPFDSILAYLRERLEDSRDFFQHAEMILDIRSKTLQTSEIVLLHQLLREKSGVKLIEVLLDEDTSFFLDIPVRGTPTSPCTSQRISENNAIAPVIIKRSCRSGARIVSPSDCVILGDVNPGAEVVAVGDILVFGNLRGVAHAGATGNRNARIWALSIEPHQLRIADLMAIPPRGSKPTSRRSFELAEVREDTIEVLTL